MQNERLPLAGSWVCVLDRADVGCTEHWYERELEGVRVSLPGSLAEQNVGDPVTIGTAWTGTIFDRSFYEKPEFAPYRRDGDIKVPFFLQPETVWVGAAWYQREIVIPESWRDRRVVLQVERMHWMVRVWLDGREVGVSESLSTPHRFELGCAVPPGRHRLTLQVDNRLKIEVGENAHSVSDHTQGNWNGLIGRLDLLSTATTWIADLQLFPSVRDGSVRVQGRLQSTRESDFSGCKPRLRIKRLDTEETSATEAAVAVDSDGAFAATVKLGADAARWDEFSPVLYQASLTLPNGETESATFGLREVRVRGRDILLNGRKIFLRGTLDCCVYPKTGYPPMDRESWLGIFKRYQAHGLNHVRFHSWCPPEAAFAAADELGVYLQVECAAWPNSVAVLAFNSPAGIGDGREIDRWMYRETDRILREYGNHPSFLLLAHGNEPGGPHHATYLAKWVSHFVERDPRRLYSAAAGWPELPENQFHVLPGPRIHQWGDGLKCRINGSPPATTHDYRAEIERRAAPVISHEIGQWCTYPPLGDTGKYTGHLKAKNYEIFRDSLRAHGLADRLNDFVAASGKLQALVYKEEIEASLRTAGQAGFQLLGLQDFPGQGTAPVGVLDVFGASKGYVEADEFRRFCGPTVLLARMERRVFEEGETFLAEIDVAHFGAAELVDVKIRWALQLETPVVAGGADPGGLRADLSFEPRGQRPRLQSDASVVVLKKGEIRVGGLPVGQTRSVGRIEFVWQDTVAPARHRLAVEIVGVDVANEWDLWLYPKSGDTQSPSHSCLSSNLDEALARAVAGEGVLLLLSPDQVAGEVALGFSPIFWNTSCTQGQAPHTLGILCDPTHPALHGFPTEFHSNWQWWYVLQRAAAMQLDRLPVAVKPIVSVIDDWFTNRRLGLIFEAKVGAGRMVVCSAAVLGKGNPVARQLLESLAAYVAGDNFAPEVVVTPEELATVVRRRSAM